MQESLPRIEPTDEQHLRLVEPFSINPGVTLEALDLQTPLHRLPADVSSLPSQHVRHQLTQLQARIHRNYLTELISRTLSGGGLSDLSIETAGVRVEISGLLSREGQRTPFLVRGFLYEAAGPFGGVVFYDIRAFGRPGLPAPALIPLLAARTGRHGPLKVRGCITLQLDLPSLLLRWGVAAYGWKIPAYQQLQLQQISQVDSQLQFHYLPSSPNTSLPFAQHDPQYPEWTTLCMAEQRHLKIESLIGNGDYTTAMQAYSEAMWREPDDPFLQERLMQLCIASPQRDLWSKAYRIAEGILQHNPQSASALNCMAQYAEGIQDLHTAAHFYKQMGEVARRQSAHVEASLAFGKAAELMERIDANHAYELWQLAASHNGNYRPAITALTRHALKAGQFAQAEQILRQLIEQTPPSVERARYHLSLAGLYRSRLRDLYQAREQLDQAALYLNEDLSFLRELAEFRLATDENIDALRILDRLATRAQILKQPALYAELLYRTGQILEERLGRPSHALPRYREVLQTRPKHPQAAERIQALTSMGVAPEPLPLGSFEAPALLIAEKEQALRTYTDLPTEQLRLTLELCRLYWQQQDLARAIQAGQQAIRIQPDHEVAWQLLEEICVRTDRHEELAVIHKQLAAQATTDEDALRHLEEALRLLPSDHSIIQQLGRIYDQLQEWEKLDVLYSRWHEIANPEEKPQILSYQAQLREQHMQRLDLAELSYVQAFQQAEDKQPFLANLLQYYIRHQAWDKMDLQLSHLAQQLEPDAQALLYAEKGRQLLPLPSHRPQALAAYQKALLCAPENLDVLRPTIELLREERHTAELAPLLQRLADLTDDPDQEQQVRRELAQLLDRDLSQPGRALEQYEALASLDPSDLDAQQRLAELYLSDHRASDAAAAYQTLLQHLAPSEQPERSHRLLPHMIRVFDQTSQDHLRDKALDLLLTVAPDFGQDTELPPVLKECDDENGIRARAYFWLGLEHKQASLFLQAVTLLSDTAPEAAQACWEIGLTQEPLHPGLWTYRLRQAAPDERPALWEQLQSAIFAQTLHDKHKAQLQTLFQDLQQEDFPSEEIAPLHETLQTHQILISSLAQWLAQALEHEDKLDQALQVRKSLLSDLPPGRERSELRFELAVQQLRVLEDREGGQQALWDLLADDPGFQEAFYELQQLFDEEGDLIGFVEAAEATAARATPGPARAELTLQIFELYRALYYEPEDTLAFLDRNVQSAQDDPHTLQLLAAAYEEANALGQAAELYGQLGQRDDANDLAVQALEQASELYMDQLDQPDVAIDLLQALLAKQPGHERAFERLNQVYENLWMWEELAALINQYVETLDDPEEAARRLVQLGELYLGRMEEYDRALDSYRRALRQTPRNLQVLRALQVLYEELEDWPALVSALKAITRVEVDREALCNTYLQIASLSLDRLYRIDDAQEYYQLAHNQQPDRTDPIEGLIALYDATDQLERMAESAALLAILCAKQEREAATQEALQQLVDAVQRAAQEERTPESILRSVIQERQESASLSQHVLDLLRDIVGASPEHSELLALHPLLSHLYRQQIQELVWLLRLWHLSEAHSVPFSVVQTILDFVRNENWSGVVQQLVKLQQDAEPEEVASYQLSIAEIALFSLQQPQQATAFAQRALDLGAPPERALWIIESIQWSTQDHLSLETLLSFAKENTSPEDLGRALYHLASSFLLQDAQWADALQCLVEASCLTSHGEDLATILGDLRRMQLALDQDQLHAEDLAAMIPPDAPPAHQALMQAWIAFQHQQLEPGVEQLRVALEADPENAPALRLMGHYLQQTHHVKEATALYFHFLEREWETLPFDEIVELCVSLADLYNQQQHWDNALFYLEQATKFIPEDPRILALHIQALEQSGRWEELLDLLQSHLENPEPTDNIADLWYRVGQLQQHHLNDPNEALSSYENALQSNPNHEASRLAAQQLSQQNHPL